MANRTMAVRYARALPEALPGEDELTRAGDELRQAVELLDQPAVVRTIGSSVMPATQKKDLADRLLAAAGFHSAVKRLVTLLAETNSLSCLGEVAEAVAHIADRRRNIVAAEVTTAVEIDPNKKEDYRRALEEMTGRTVKLKTSVDPSILGGAVTRMGSEVHDGSLRRKLERLHARLRGE